MVMELPDYTIRPYTRADLDGIMAIETASFAEDAWPRRDFVDIGRAGEGVFLVMESGEEIAGYCIGVTIEGEGYIASIAVHPQHQGKGVGRGLMQALIDVLRS